jgi:hypothetical protein
MWTAGVGFLLVAITQSHVKLPAEDLVVWALGLAVCLLGRYPKMEAAMVRLLVSMRKYLRWQIAAKMQMALHVISLEVVGEHSLWV